MKTFSDLVENWGAFEKLIAKLHETGGSVTVIHNSVQIGRSGAPRQIDVLIRQRMNPYEHVVVAECKYLNTPVERMHVDALETTIRELGAQKGVIFSAKGFQSGAITQARAVGIDLYKVRDLEDVEWGADGRTVDFYVHIVQPSIGEISLAKYEVEACEEEDSQDYGILEMSFGNRDDAGTVVTYDQNGRPGRTLEEFIGAEAQAIMHDLIANNAIKFTEHDDGVAYIGLGTGLSFGSAIRFPLGKRVIRLKEIHFNVVIFLEQSRIVGDRAAEYEFVVALDDAVRGLTATASRKINANFTNISSPAERAEFSRETIEDRIGEICGLFEKAGTMRVSKIEHDPEKDGPRYVKDGARLRNGCTAVFFMDGYYPYEKIPMDQVTVADRFVRK